MQRKPSKPDAQPKAKPYMVFLIILITIVMILTIKMFFMFFIVPTAYILPHWIYNDIGFVIFLFIVVGNAYLVLCARFFSKYFSGSWDLICLLINPLIVICIMRISFHLLTYQFASKPFYSKPFLLTYCSTSTIRKLGPKISIYYKDEHGNSSEMVFMGRNSYCSTFNQRQRPIMVFYGRQSIFGTYIDGMLVQEPRF